MVTSKPCSSSKWASAGAAANAKFSKHSAYKSMYKTKYYKSHGGKFCSGSKSSANLTRWKKEKWRSEKGKKDYGGRKVGNFRPTVKVSSKTPKLMQDVSKSDRAKARARKRSGKNAKY